MSLEFQNKCYICEFQLDEYIKKTCSCETQYIFFNSINLFVSENILKQINSYLEKNIPKQNIIITIKDGKLKNIVTIVNNSHNCGNLSVLCIESSISPHKTFKNNFTFKLPQKHLKIYSKL